MTQAEVAANLERWLKVRRDEKRSAGLDYSVEVIDDLLGEVRDCAVEGWLPWQRMDRHETEM